MHVQTIQLHFQVNQPTWELKVGFLHASLPIPSSLVATLLRVFWLARAHDLPKKPVWCFSQHSICSETIIHLAAIHLLSNLSRVLELKVGVGESLAPCKREAPLIQNTSIPNFESNQVH